MWKKVYSLRGFAGVVGAVVAAAVLASVAGPVLQAGTGSPGQRFANTGTSHVFVPTTVSIPDSDAEPAPTF